MKKLKKIILILLTFVLISQPILSALFIPISAADVGSFDNTTIEDDLGADTIKMYPKQGYGDCEVIHILEYAYSEHPNYQKIYNVYLYIYNPTGKPISMLNEGYNLVSMVTGYGENGDKEINTVDLEYVSKTSDNLIYKFKLAKSQQIYAFAKEYASTHDGARRYEFTKLQVKHASGLTQTKEFAKIYEFSGYSAYCDKNKSPESTLQCKDFVNSTIQLKLQHTNYRAEAQKNGIQDEINSVYFSIPNRYYNDNESLYGVNAEWYEYKTKPIYVTSDAEAISGLWSMRNITINEFGQQVDSNGNVLTDTLSYWRVLWGETVQNDVLVFRHSYIPFTRYSSSDLVYNNLYGFCYAGDHRYGFFADFKDQIDWLIKVDNTWSDNAYKVSSAKVKEYMEIYTNEFRSQPKIRDKYAAGLFETSIDSDRIQFLDNKDSGATSGKMTKKFTSDQKMIFTDLDKSQTEWNRFWFGDKYLETAVSPIVVISYGDLELSKEVFSERYLVSMQDVDAVMNYARTSYSKAETPVLLRFAVTDYYSEKARFDYVEDEYFQDLSDYDGYVAQETMFLDFNVIELEFKSEEGVIRSVGAVAEPIDIINGLTPPSDLVEDEEWYQKLIALILVIIVLMVVYFLINTYVPFLGKIIRWIAGAFWWLFKSLVKLITWPFRALLSSAGRSIKRKLKIKGRRGRPKGKRGRPPKKKPKKETRNQRLMKETFANAKAKASETASKLGTKIKDKTSDVLSKIRNRGK